MVKRHVTNHRRNGGTLLVTILDPRWRTTTLRPFSCSQHGDKVTPKRLGPNLNQEIQWFMIEIMLKSCFMQLGMASAARLFLPAPCCPSSPHRSGAAKLRLHKELSITSSWTHQRSATQLSLHLRIVDPQSQRGSHFHGSHWTPIISRILMSLGNF